MKTFVDSLAVSDKQHIDNLRQTILRNDENVKEEPGKIMSVDKTLNYMQEGVFKYGLAKTEKHYSFHSMVMYAYPDIAKFVKANTKGLKLQKGCINFQNPKDFPPDVFTEMIKMSAEKDFSVVMKRYKK